MEAGHRYTIAVLAVFAGLFLLAVVGVSSPTGLFTTESIETSANVTCGETILVDTVMESGIEDCATESGIIIGANDITLDCDGRVIDGLDTVATYGVNATGRNNITIINCDLTDWASGILLYGTDDSLVEDNTANSNVDAGIAVDQGSDNNVINQNEVFDNGVDGIDILASANNNVTNNIVYSNNNDEGIEVSASTNTFVSENNVTSNNIGISVSGDGNTVTMNHLEFNENYSIYVTGDDNEISDNTAVDTNIGIAIESADNNLVTNNNASYSEYGITLQSSDSNNVTSNVAELNAQLGIGLIESTGTLVEDNIMDFNGLSIGFGGLLMGSAFDNTIRNNNASGNWVDILSGDFGAGPSENNPISNFRLATAVIDADGKGFGINASTNVPADPAGFESIGVSFLSGNTTESAYLEINVSYSEAMLDAGQESMLVLAKYDASSWITETSDFASGFNVDTVNDKVFANITDFTGTILPGDGGSAFYVLMIETGEETGSGDGPPSGGFKPAVQPEIVPQLPAAPSDSSAPAANITPEEQENLAAISGAATFSAFTGSWSLWLLLLLILIVMIIILYEYHRYQTKKT